MILKLLRVGCSKQIKRWQDEGENLSLLLLFKFDVV